VPSPWPAPPRPLAVHHLAVVVRDLDRAEAFYGGVLGLPVAQRWTDDAGAPRSVWFSLSGGAFLAVERASAGLPARLVDDGGLTPPKPPPPDLPGWHCVALAIAPAERAPLRAHLTASGHPVERESPYTLYARDPEGNLVALSHYPEPAT
jgi:glyoxylase I family protein